MHRAHKHRCLCSIPPEGVSVRSKLTHYLPHRGNARSASPRKLHHIEGESALPVSTTRAHVAQFCSPHHSVAPVFSGRLSAGRESRFALLVNLRLPHYTSIHPVFHHRAAETHQGSSATLLAPQGKLITLAQQKGLFRVGCCCI